MKINALIAVLLSAVVTVHLPQASAGVLTAVQTADNLAWPNQTPGFATMDDGTWGRYDGFKITISGTPGAAVGSINLAFPYTGLFDDTVGFDINGDGVVDYAIGQNDWQYSVGNNLINPTGIGYQPWSNITDTQNLKSFITIGPTKTEAYSEYYGQTLFQNPSGAINNLAGITLSSLGLGTVIPGSGSMTTTGELRIGYLNVGGPGGGLPSLDTSSFSFQFNNPAPAAVPEPSTFAVLAMAGLAIARQKLRSRRLLASERPIKGDGGQFA